MDRPYVLPQIRGTVATTLPRQHIQAPLLKISDLAAKAMIDFQRESPPTVSEDQSLDRVLDEMFRLGVRALLVVRERFVTGLITVEDACRAPDLARLHDTSRDARLKRRIADVMTAPIDMPAVDWQVIEHARVRDLLEIFDGVDAQHLVVVEDEMHGFSTVRGFIHRNRLERQLNCVGRALNCLDTFPHRQVRAKRGVERNACARGERAPDKEVACGPNVPHSSCGTATVDAYLSALVPIMIDGEQSG